MFGLPDRTKGWWGWHVTFWHWEHRWYFFVWGFPVLRGRRVEIG